MPKRRRRTRRAAGAVHLFVDSGAWIALRSRRDQHHAEADRLFREAIALGILLVSTSLVLAEVHRLTLFRAGVEPALRLFDRVDASPSLSLWFPGPDHHAAARRWLERLAPRPLTYTDAVSLAVIEAAGCTHVLGFDADFEVAGFALWRGASD